MSAPERIYLQWIEDESAPYIHEGVTWCADRIEDDDVEYTRTDKATAAWQPIATAPAEGQFLVYMPDDERQPIQVANWHPNVKIIGNCFSFDMEKPTHWQPLPAPPA